MLYLNNDVTMHKTRIINNMMNLSIGFDQTLQGQIKKLQKWGVIPGLHVYTEGSFLVYQGFSVCSKQFTHYYIPTHQIHEER